MAWRPENWEEVKESIISEEFDKSRGIYASPYQSDLFFGDGLEAGADAILNSKEIREAFTQYNIIKGKEV